jgi:hypothetical protein
MLLLVLACCSWWYGPAVGVSLLLALLVSLLQAAAVGVPAAIGCRILMFEHLLL